MFFRGVATKGRAFEWTQNRTCSRAKRVGFTNKQIQMCRKNTDLMPTIYRSAVGAVSLCQQLFDLRRWNCSSVLKAPKLPRDLTTGNFWRKYLFSSITIHDGETLDSHKAYVNTRCQCCKRTFLHRDTAAFQTLLDIKL